MENHSWVIAFLVAILACILLSITSTVPLRLCIYILVFGLVLLILLELMIVLLSAKVHNSYRENRQSLPYTPLFAGTSSWFAESDWLLRKTHYQRKSLLPRSFVVSQAIDELIDFALRDFVNSWYQGISGSAAFSNELDRIIRIVYHDVQRRLNRQDFLEAAVLRLLPLLTEHLRYFYEAERIVRGRKLNRTVTESEELDLAIAAKYNGGALHLAASLSSPDTRLLQQEHLRILLMRLLPVIYPQWLTQSKAVATIAREIITCGIITPVMALLSDPDTWNQLLEEYGRKMLQDRKTVRRLRAALNEHAQPIAQDAHAPLFPQLQPGDNERKYERFIRAIRQCKNLSDARRFRTDVASRLEKATMSESSDPMYLRRLETGKKFLDHRVNLLNGAHGASRQRAVRDSNRDWAKPRLLNARIIDILRDSSGLSYFMEFMDRQNRMPLVQFWIVVDGFRNPLEDEVAEDAHIPDSAVQWTQAERTDIAQISETYMWRSEIKISQATRASVQEFLDAGANASQKQFMRARYAILRAQTAVLEEMEQRDFPSFRKSDLFYKLLASEKGVHQGSVNHFPASDTSIDPENPSKLSQGLPTTGIKSRSISTTRGAKENVLAPQIVGQQPEILGNTNFSNLIQPPKIEGLNLLFGNEILPSTKSSREAEQAHMVGSSIFGETEPRVVEAIHAALDTIISGDVKNERNRNTELETLDQIPTCLGNSRTLQSHDRGPSLRAQPNTEKRDRDKPNLTSLGLINQSSRLGVFRDDLLFEDEKFLEDEYVDSDEINDGKEIDEEIHEAVPGDLGLSEAISALTTDLDRLVAQRAVLETLTRKAELTNNTAELRILGKSRSSLDKEIHRKELQRQQYIVQESDNSLFGRAVINIKSVIVGKEEDGQEFALYLIEVQREAGENMPAATWVIARRYSEFHDLHQRLRQGYSEVRHLEFPRRRLVMKLQPEFLQKRQLLLENYLRKLLMLPAVCRSRDLRAFLSQRPIISKGEGSREGERTHIVTRIYNSMADGVDELLANIPVLDQLSLTGQNLISGATSQNGQSSSTPAMQSVSPHAEDITQLSRNDLDSGEGQPLEPFVKPICDVFLELFDLNRSQNWLRGRAVVVLLQQLLGGAVERRIRDAVEVAFSDTNILHAINLAKDVLWPGGRSRPRARPRTAAEKKASRKEASLVLAALIPDFAAGLVGRGNAQAASRRVFAAMNNERLNIHLTFQLLDEVLAILYPEATVWASKQV